MLICAVPFSCTAEQSQIISDSLGSCWYDEHVTWERKPYLVYSIISTNMRPTHENKQTWTVERENSLNK